MRGIRKITILSNFQSESCNEVVGCPCEREIVSTFTEGKRRRKKLFQTESRWSISKNVRVRLFLDLFIREWKRGESMGLGTYIQNFARIGQELDPLCKVKKERKDSVGGPSVKTIESAVFSS